MPRNLDATTAFAIVAIDPIRYPMRLANAA